MRVVEGKEGWVSTEPEILSDGVCGDIYSASTKPPTC